MAKNHLKKGKYFAVGSDGKKGPVQISNGLSETLDMETIVDQVSKTYIDHEVLKVATGYAIAYSVYKVRTSEKGRKKYTM